jgi:Flp pilus assembly pilin Flp
MGQNTQLSGPAGEVLERERRNRVKIGRSGPRLASRVECPMSKVLRILWKSDQGQDIAEYAVMLAVILVLVIGTIRLVGGNANNAFSSVANNLQ